VVIVLVGCEEVASATMTPTTALSGPTLEASPVIRPVPPTELPPDFIGSGQNNPTAAALPSGGELPPVPIATAIPGSGQQIVQIILPDGARLEGDLYQSGGERVAGVVILATDRAAWGDFPARLQADGFTVLVITPRDITSVADFQAVLQAFTAVGTVDPARIGVIGASETADLALLGCAAELLCDTVVLLSPVSREALLNVMSAYNPRPLLVAASEDDAGSFVVAQAVQESASGEVLFQPFTSAGQGTAMLENRPDLGELVMTWLRRWLVES
jgi:hypothetical protein